MYVRFRKICYHVCIPIVHLNDLFVLNLVVLRSIRESDETKWNFYFNRTHMEINICFDGNRLTIHKSNVKNIYFAETLMLRLLMNLIRLDII